MGTRLGGLALAIAAVAAPSATAATKPVLTLSFDEGFDGTGPSGIVKAVVEGAPALVVGRTGRALESGPSTGYLAFPTEGILDPRGGTIEMWVRPVNWRAAEEDYHVFLDARGEGVLYLYKFYKGSDVLLLAGASVDGPYRESREDAGSWIPGEWHHLAGTWSADTLRLYVDGRPAGPCVATGNLPRKFGATFRIGDHPWGSSRATSSLIDDVRIYDRPLGEEEIAAHFRGDFDAEAPLRRDRSTLAFDLHPERWDAEVRLWAGGAFIEDGRLEARAAIVPAGGGLPAEATRLPFRAGQAVGSVPVGSREPGEYEVLAEVRRDGEPVFDLRRSLVIPRLDWRGSAAGADDRVIPPWTPVEAEGRAVRCWGREYRFDRGPLPSQLRSAGEDLLAAPVRLVLASGGAEVRWSRRRADVSPSGSGTRRIVFGYFEGKLGASRARVDVTATVEYDGVTVFELSGDSVSSIPLDALAVEIPLAASRAVYRHRHRSAGPALSGRLPEGEGIVDGGAFAPFYWLGDDDRGLFWFAESDESWPNGRSADAIEVVRAGGRVLLRLNLLGPGQTMPRGWKFVFGLQATPVKPMPSGRRRWRLQPARGASASILWPVPKGDSLRYYGYPEAADPAAFRSRVDALHAEGVKAVPYLLLTHLSSAAPEWPFFRTLWGTGLADARSTDVLAYGSALERISPYGKEFADFIVRKTIEFVATHGLDGIYHDNTIPFPLASVDSGTGYRRGGRTYPSYPILGYRELYRRMAVALAGLGRETLTVAHMSGEMDVPVVGWDDAYLDGEQFAGLVEDSYPDVLPLDAFRAEFMGRQWGVAPFFLPELKPPWSERVEPTRGMMALLMLHDVSLWPIRCNVSVVNEALAALDAFGYADAEFIPYFDARPPAATGMKDVHVSAYRKGDGSVLLVAANLSREDRAGELRIDGPRLGLPLRRVLTWPDRREIPAEDGLVRVEIPRQGYLLLFLPPGQRGRG